MLMLMCSQARLTYTGNAQTPQTIFKRSGNATSTLSTGAEYTSNLEYSATMPAHQQTDTPGASIISCDCFCPQGAIKNTLQRPN